MKNSFMAKIAQAPMTMHNLNLFSDYDVSKNGEKRKHRWHRCFSIDNKKWNMVDFETIRQIANALPAFVGMSDDNDFVPAINELGGKLIDMTLDSPWLREKEVTDHCNIRRHPISKMRRHREVHQL